MNEEGEVGGECATCVEYTWEETLAFEGGLLPRVHATYGGDGMAHSDYKAAYDPPKKMTIHTAQPEGEVENLRQEGSQIMSVLSRQTLEAALALVIFTFISSFH